MSWITLVLKPVISSDHAINWYIGNYILAPSNALREDEALLDLAFNEMEGLRAELNGQRMTHKQFLDLMKERGVHKKYYRYHKPEPLDCPICRAFKRRRFRP